jgi:hypothetical protein
MRGLRQNRQSNRRMVVVQSDLESGRGDQRKIYRALRLEDPITVV